MNLSLCICRRKNMSYTNPLCRLCMSTKCLFDIFEDEPTELAKKILFCVGIQVSPKDSLPTLICKRCLKHIKKMHRFKQMCFETENKFQAMASSTVDVYFEEVNMPPVVEDSKINIKYETYLDSKIENEPLDEEIRLSNNNLICSPGIQGDRTSDQMAVVNNMKQEIKSDKKLPPKTKKPNIRQCTFCLKTFTRAESCVIHMRSHTGERPYLCTICGSKSTKLQDLKRHMKIHSDERMHHCTLCSKSFKRSADLICHMRTHTAVRLFKCTLCSKDYASHSGLRKHKMKTHG